MPYLLDTNAVIALMKNNASVTAQVGLGNRTMPGEKDRRQPRFMSGSGRKWGGFL